MVEALTNGGLFSSRRQLLRLLAVTMLLPAAIVAADEAVYRFVVRSAWSSQSLFLFYSLMVIQVGLLGVAAGSWIETPSLCWGTFVWGLLLMLLLLFSIGSQPARPNSAILKLCYAFGSAQVGLLAFWVGFGPAPLRWRLPLAIVAASVLVWSVPGQVNREWMQVLVLQVAGLIAAVAFVRLWGFTLVAAVGSRGEQKVDDRLQFSLRHLLYSITAVSIALALVQGVQSRVRSSATTVDFAQSFMNAACLSLVGVAAIWVVLGRGKPLLRIAIGLLLTLAVATLLWWFNVVRIETAIGNNAWGGFTYRQYGMYHLGRWWYILTTLSGLFLADLLLIFRVRGYRLARRVRQS